MSRREYNKQETIRAIQNTFLSQFAEGGIDRISVTRLCRDCGISKSTFYLYFDDKYAVLEAIEDELIQELREIVFDLNKIDLEGINTGMPQETVTSVVQFLRERRVPLRALLGVHGDANFTYRWKKDISESFLERFRAQAKNDRKASIACAIFTSSIIGLYTHFLFDMPDLSDREMSIIIGNLLKYTLIDFDAYTETF